VEVLVSGLAGAVAAALLWLGLRSTFAAPLFGRTNFRGATVPVGAGIVLVFAALLVAAVEGGLVGLGVDQEVVRAGDLVLLATVGFGLLGFVDDVAEVGDAKGFAGHLGALREGRLTTGGLKLLGGVALGVVVVAPLDADRPVRVLVDALLVAGAANVGNLFDRAPGRTTKVGVLCGAVLLATHLSDPPAGVAVVLGAALGLLAFDLREQLMLGDAGANPIGAAVGLGLVLACGFPVRIGALVVVVALNALSEKVSFSAVIARTPVLRELDRLGRRP
jgi:UDP-N-acetylmuramyl pentapeptide phosphotransferase/UDP-N-acetylglucosamine-1-phosphate transferase